MKVHSKKMKNVTCKKCKRPVGNILHPNTVDVIKNCNVVIPKLNTKVHVPGKLESSVASNLQSSEKDRHKKENTLYETARNKNDTTKRKKVKQRAETEVTVILKTKCNTDNRKSLLKKSTLKKVVKKVRFKIPIAKYKIIPLKKRNTKKLIVMLARCDEALAN